MAGAVSAYLSLVLVWLVVGLMVDSQRIVPLLTSSLSFSGLVGRRAMLWFNLRRQASAQLQELADALLQRLVGAGISALAFHVHCNAQPCLERLKACKGSDADLFQVLATAEAAQEELQEPLVVSIARAQLAYRPVLSRGRLAAIVANLRARGVVAAESAATARLDLSTFIAFQKAVRQDVIQLMLQHLGLDASSGWRKLRLLLAVGFLLFPLLALVLTAFPISQDSFGLAFSGLLPVALGFFLNGTLPSAQLQDLGEQLEEQCAQWQAGPKSI